MASYKLKVKSSWKTEDIGLNFEDDPEFGAFGGLEVLDEYEVVKGDFAASYDESGDANDIKSKSKIKQKGKKRKAESALAPIQDETKKKKKKRKPKRKSKENGDHQPSPDKQTEEVTAEETTPEADNSEDEEEETENLPPTLVVPTKLTNDMSAWKDLLVPELVLKALDDLGFVSPTLIQALSLPAAIRDRQDILGAAETGSGKTLAFGIPILDKILKLKSQQADENDKNDRVLGLVLTPTRELCVQVKNHLTAAAKYTGIKVVSVFGGMSTHKQLRLLSAKPEVIVATPGRLWDLMQQGEKGNYLDTVKQVPVLVIDEADRMVEKGHFEELTSILNIMKMDEDSCRARQSFVFSATLMYVHSAPDRLNKRKKGKTKRKVVNTIHSKIEELIETVGILKRPKIIDVTQKQQTAEKLIESCVFCTQTEKDLYLYYFLTRYPGRTLVFTNSIDCIRRLLSLFILLRRPLLPLHADMHQKQRLKNLERFTAHNDSVLLATDVAARGLDIPGVEHVIHYQIPRTAESYIHRSGRTARAQQDGLSVMIVDEKEIQNYKRIIKSLHKDDALVMFPVEHSELLSLRATVTLAQKIDSTQHKLDKSVREDRWFSKMAEEAEIELSDHETEWDKEEICRRERTERKQIQAWKTELSSLLDNQSVDTKSSFYSGKYPTASGKLQLPKAAHGTKDVKAITLISRKRRN